MGIDSLWPRILKGEGEEYVEKKPLGEHVKTCFVDGQVMLMKSTMPPHVTTWDQFVTHNFCSKIQRLHSTYHNVILSFDNYHEVPIYKSIEQAKRSTVNRKPFNFEKGDSFPDRPPGGDVWSDALMNRNYKTMVISIITKVMAAKYCPPIKPRSLILDFCNVVKIDYGHYGCKREVMAAMKPLGESDIKFLRYVPFFGAMLIESVDSDVLLIAMQFMQKHSQELEIYVKRMASKSIEDAQDSTQKRKAGEKKQRTIQYEIINIKKLLATVHVAIRQAVGTEFILSPVQMTRYSLFLMLMCGSDYSKKLPQIGPSFVWEHLHISIPMLTLCFTENEEGFHVDESACMNLLFVALYREKFQKHVKEESESFDDIVADLQASKLSDRTKKNLPDRESLVCLIRTVLWTMRYWELCNEGPPIDTSGKHGFILRNGKIEFGTELGG
tara:strand:- start:2524 stop:3846 length:1323 start_codon:yes stop_codon:yes gene_type:complete